MLGILTQYSGTYLAIFATLTTLFFALPIFIQPLAWARLMGWEIPQQTHLAIYFGRCLGAFILIVEILMLRGALSVEHRIATFEVLYLVFGFMLVVHIYGAIRRIQPLSETLEIGLWASLLVLNTLFFPATSYVWN